MDGQAQEDPRPEKSLGILTRKFVELMLNSSEGILDLKQAAVVLNITQKRRIYDITNVLEGVGLIRKANKNSVQWLGSADSQVQGLLESTKVQMIRQQMFKAHEEELDRHLRFIRQNLKATKKDPIQKLFAYVTRDDLLKCYGDEQTVLTIKNHKEVHKPGLLTENDEGNVILDRALIVTSEGQLDVRLVSTTGDSYKKIEKPSCSQESKNDEAEGSITQEIMKRVSKRKQDFTTGLRVKRKKETTQTTDVSKDGESSESETETDIELKESACIILGEVVDHSKEKFALREFELNPAMIRLNPPAHTEYQTFSLYDDEGIIDLFDIPCDAEAQGRRYDDGESSSSGKNSQDFV